MAKKLILHIGFGKTGSSYLQSCLASCASELLEQSGIYYPDSPSNKAASSGQITSGNGVRLAKYLNPKNALNIDVTGFREEFTKFLRDTEHSTVIFSSEFLANFDPLIMERFKCDVEDAGYELHLICYVRSIAGHAYSNYSQRVKRNKYTESFYYYLQNEYKAPFRGLLKRIAGCFEEGSYNIRSYDLVRDRLWLDFLQQLPHVADFSYQWGGKGNQIVNRSLTLFELDFMRMLNGYLDNTRQATQASDALIYANLNLKVEYVLTQKEADLILSKFEAVAHYVNQFVAQEHEVQMISDEFKIGERASHQMDEFQMCMVSVLASVLRKA